ncbi:MAG TPA: alpha/beta hydrolase [Nitrososphaeraceae archaeon]
MKIVFQDPTFSSQLLRTIGQTYYGGADIGECLSTAYRIEEGNFESWYSQWLKTAQRVNKYADESFSSGHKASARDGYLRASNYYRAAEFLLIDPEDPRILETWGRSKECFNKAAELFSSTIESIEIPYEGTSLPGHMYTAGENKKRPTMIAHGGFDSTLLQLYKEGTTV